MKKEYPPLLDPGLHEMELDELEIRFADPFGENTERHHLVDRFLAFVDRLKKVGVSFDIWVNGSFVTEKEDPADIDAVFVIPAAQLNGLNQQQRTEIHELLGRGNKLVIKNRFQTDAFLVRAEDAQQQIYWKDFFGTFRDDKTQKGLALIRC